MANSSDTTAEHVLAQRLRATKPPLREWLARRMENYADSTNASRTAELAEDDTAADVELCAHCSEPIEPNDPTAKNGFQQVVHAACVPPAPPCPDGTDAELWADGVKMIFRAPRESDIAYALRLELFCRLFGAAFTRQKSAKEVSAK